MQPVKPGRTRGRISALLLAIDAWIDTSVYAFGARTTDAWDSIGDFFRRFRLFGTRRLAVELSSEAVTFGAVGLVVLLALAQPAFEATKGDWRTQGDFAVTFLDRYGKEIGRRGIFQLDSVPVEEMPPYVVAAVLATEDRRFYAHHGIDPTGLFRALAENVRANAVVQGGSTLSQQLAKNLFLSNERTLERKISEAFLSVWLEANLSKQEILQLYLDRAYMGGGAFGIAAAAEFYFGKSVKEIDLAQAAMLAGLFKAPTRYAPHLDLAAARNRADVVLTNLVDSGFMSPGQVLAARMHPASIVSPNGAKSPDYFLDWAFEQAKQIGTKIGVRTMVAQTTVDPALQTAAEESLEYHLATYGKQYDFAEGAIVLIDRLGAVRAVVGGRDYGQSQFNRATQALRQAGSSFKPYVYAEAMEQGFTPQSVISDGPINWSGWSPKNYSRGYSGKINLTTALVKSINTVPVRLAKDHLGIPPIKALAEAMGVESKLEGHKTMALGTSGMTVMDQATGYQVFANGGYAGMRYGISKITTHGGQVVWDHDRDAPLPHRVLAENSVKEMNEMLSQVPEWGTARRAALDGIKSAGKTGTTQAYRDAWYVGFTGNFTAAVWLGNDDYSPTKNMTGGTVPAMVWKRLMTFAHTGIEPLAIPGLEPPPAPVANGKLAPDTAAQLRGTGSEILTAPKT